MSRAKTITTAMRRARFRVLVVACFYLAFGVLGAWAVTVVQQTNNVLARQHPLTHPVSTAPHEALVVVVTVWFVLGSFAVACAIFLGRGSRIAWAVSLAVAILAAVLDVLGFLLLAWVVLSHQRGYLLLIGQGLSVWFQLWVGDALWSRDAIASYGWRRRRAQATVAHDPNPMFTWPADFVPGRFSGDGLSSD